MVYGKILLGIEKFYWSKILCLMRYLVQNWSCEDWFNEKEVVEGCLIGELVEVGAKVA